MAVKLKFWIAVFFIPIVVYSRGIKKSKQEEVARGKGRVIQDGIKDHKTTLSFDLDNCTDCQSSRQGFAISHAKFDDNIPKNKQSTDYSAKRKGEKHERLDGNTSRRPTRKKAADTGTKREKKPPKHDTKNLHNKGRRKKHGKKLNPDSMVSDITDNTSQDRWRTNKLKQLPGVARLEQRLHPTVQNPIQNLMMSMDRILQVLSGSVRRVDLDHKLMFNATRYDIMMNVRKELMNIADGNDKAYDAVLQASLLTKDIYRRAHRERLQGPRTTPAAVSSDIMPKLRTIPLRERYLIAQEELHRSRRLKHRIALADRERYQLETRLMQIQRQIEGSLPERSLQDLIRISNQTIRILQTFKPTFGTGGRIHLFGHMYQNSMQNMRESRDQMYSAKNTLTLAKSQIMEGRRLRNQILRSVRNGANGVVSDMPFDDSRMMMWAVVDEARHHAEMLAKKAIDIHRQITPMIKKAKAVLADKNTLGRKIEETARKLEQQIKTLVATLDKISVIIDDEDILRSRCEAKQKYNHTFYMETDAVLDCDVYITEGSGVILVEGSGEEGSGELDTDTIIPETNIIDSMGKPDSAIPGTKEDTIIFHKENNSLQGVTRTSDDEDMVNKKTNLATTAIPDPTNLVIEDTEEDKADDFIFTDFFGLFSDDPMAGVHGNNKFNKFILERLAVYSKESLEVFGTADKIKEALEDLQSVWNKTKETFDNFENNMLSANVFLHSWAAKLLYFQAVHDRVMSLKDTINLQSELIEKQCSEAVAIVEKKLEAAEERQTRDQDKAENSADPEVVKEAVNSVKQVTEDVKEMVELKKVYPDPCGTIESLDTAIRTNISELRQKIQKAKLIASSLQMPVSMKGDGYLDVPLERDDTTANRLTLSMDIKPSVDDGLVAAVKTDDSGSLAVSTKDNSPVLTVFDDDGYDIGKLTADMQLENNETYNVLIERLGSLFSMFVYNILDNSLLANDSVFVETVDIYQKNPSTVYIAGAPEDFPEFGGSLWQGCIGHVSVNGRYLNLLRKSSGGNMTQVCYEISVEPEKENLVLGGSGYAKYALDTLSNLGRGAMDNIKIQFKAYTDGVLLQVVSSTTRSQETIRIEKEQIIVDFRNHYGKTLLRSKEGAFSYGKENILQVEVRPGLQLKLDLSLNGDSDAFEMVRKPSYIEEIVEDGLYIGGLPSFVNSSIVGCIRRVSINEEDATLSTAVESFDVYSGPCEDSSCIRFVDDSLPIHLGESSNRNSLIFSSTYGSTGNLIEYSKGEHLKLTLSVDLDALNIYEAVEETSERINLEGHSDGDIITVTLKASKDEVEIKVNEISKTVSYDSACGWLGCGSNKDQKYSIIVGGSSDDEEKFDGNLVEFFMNKRPLETASYLTSNNLQRCAPPRRRRRPPAVENSVVERTVC